MLVAKDRALRVNSRMNREKKVIVTESQEILNILAKKIFKYFLLALPSGGIPDLLYKFP